MESKIYGGRSRNIVLNNKEYIIVNNFKFKTLKKKKYYGDKLFPYLENIM